MVTLAANGGRAYGVNETENIRNASIARERKLRRGYIVTKIQSLHGTTPAEIFESGLEHLDGIEAVAAAVLWKDGSVTAGWSNVEPADLARLILVLDEKQRRNIV